MAPCLARNRQKPCLRLPAALLATAVFWAGCSALKPFGDLFQGDDSKPPASAPEGTYYTREAGVKLYTEPRFSSSSVATLPLYQKVHRSKLEKGFAYVRVEKTGQTGWVDNGKLIWRLPGSSAAAVRPGAPEPPPAPATGPEPRSAGSAAEQAPAAPEEPTAAEAPSAVEDVPADTAQPQETEDTDPSLFSPF